MLTSTIHQVAPHISHESCIHVIFPNGSTKGSCTFDANDSPRFYPDLTIQAVLYYVYTKRLLPIKDSKVKPLTAGAAYIRVFIFYQHIKYHIFNMLKIKCDNNQQSLKTVDLHFVKSE